MIEVENSSNSVEKEEKLFREVTVKIELKQEEDEEGVLVKALLDSGMTRLVISLEFIRKNKFRKKKLDRPIYVRKGSSSLVVSTTKDMVRALE